MSPTCALEDSSYPITLVYAKYSTGNGLQSCDVTNPARWPRLLQSNFHREHRKLTLIINKRENSLLVSNSAHASFYSVKVKHSTVGT